MLGQRCFSLVLGLCAVLVGPQPAVLAQHLELGTPPVWSGKSPRQSPQPANPLYEPNQWIDTANREAVRLSYLNDLQPTLLVDPEWDGNVETGDPGDTSLAYKEAVIRRVNWFRAMAGVPAWVQLNLEFSRKAQQAALMMSANKSLSHFPPMDWLHYTAEGAEAAANSNICIRFNQPPDPGCVAGYVEDPGESNGAAGHRRWINYPQTREMGTGDIPQNGANWMANSLWVFDSHFSDPRPPTREEFVAWPPPGYVPTDVIFDRWSFSYAAADFSAATVAMESGGQPAALQLEPVSNGFGENTIVWVPSSLGANGPGDRVIRVTVSNVMIGGAPREFSYEVISFDPNNGPNFPANGLISAASTITGPIAPEFWMDLYGQNLATQDAWDPALLTSLGGTTVTFTDSAQIERPARIHFVTPLRLQFLSPPGMASGPGTIRVTNSLGSATTAIDIVQIRPAIFAANFNGQGPAAALWTRVSGGVQTRGSSASGDPPPPNAVNVPISLGAEGDSVYLTFFGSGFRAASSVTCRINGIEVPVTYSGAQNQFPGLDQADVGPLPRALQGQMNVTVEFFFNGIPANVVMVSFQ